MPMKPPIMPMDRWILFKMRKAREMLFLDISNSSPAPPCVKNGALISRKQDGRLHGLGLNRASALRRNTAASLPMDMKAVCSRSA